LKTGRFDAVLLRASNGSIFAISRARVGVRVAQFWPQNRQVLNEQKLQKMMKTSKNGENFKKW
jgi:hypothetical protein